MDDGTESAKSLIMKLASCEQSVRDKAVRAVIDTWLPSQTQVSDEDMKKLWQGLFYCFWHADKTLYQSQLVDRLSSAVLALHINLSVQYFSVFLHTMRREWSRIDRLRLDKFYLLIRKFLHAFFVVSKSNFWDLDLTRRLMGVLIDGTFLADDKFQGNGVNYHIASIYIEELRPFLPLRKEVLELVVGPFLSVLGTVSDKILVTKIKSNIFDELLSMGKKLLESKKSGVEIDSDNDAAVLGPIALALGFSGRFYELGSSSNCHQGNRKFLFALHEEFSKLEKDFSSSGMEATITDAIVQNDEEVPDLIPISNEVEINGSAAVSKPSAVVAKGSSKKGLKKCSNAKKASNGSVKKSKKRSKDVEGVNKGDEDEVIQDVAPSDRAETDNVIDELVFNESVISNLQMQFEKVASELESSDDVASACDQLEAAGVSKKRKRAKKKVQKQSQNDQEVAENGGAAEETDADGKSLDKSAKRVRFSMKNNVVWKPNSPLPPQSVRLPPSATPKGSALKKGIPAGPINEMSGSSGKAKQKAKLKKARKGVKSIKSLKKKRSP